MTEWPGGRGRSAPSGPPRGSTGAVAPEAPWGPGRKTDGECRVGQERGGTRPLGGHLARPCGWACPPQGQGLKCSPSGFCPRPCWYPPRDGFHVCQHRRPVLARLAGLGLPPAGWGVVPRARPSACLGQRHSLAPAPRPAPRALSGHLSPGRASVSGEGGLRV